MNFFQKLDKAVEKNSSLLCVGLDPDLTNIPEHLSLMEYPLFEFNKLVIDATASSVCAYKPNAAFYESSGSEGYKQLEMTCAYLRENYPEIPILLDAKRGDIGNTSAHYARAIFEVLGADAVTVQPYLGMDAIEPFLDYADKGVFVLIRTSNPGAGELQDMLVSTKGVGNGGKIGNEDVIGEDEVEKLHMHLARTVASKWNKNNNCAVVVGATYPSEIGEIRHLIGDMTMLVPGVGAQGGDLEAVMQAGLRPDKKGIIISVSRGVTGSDPSTIGDRAKSLRDDINAYIS